MVSEAINQEIYGEAQGAMATISDEAGKLHTLLESIGDVMTQDELMNIKIYYDRIVGSKGNHFCMLLKEPVYYDNPILHKLG